MKRWGQEGQDGAFAPTHNAMAPGRRSLTAQLAPHRAREAAPAPAVAPVAVDAEATAWTAVAFGDYSRVPTGLASSDPALAAPVQRVLARAGIDDPVVVAEAADHATSGAGGALPHGDIVQRAFGHHDVSGIRAHTDRAAAEGARAMGAEAFARGNDVAFAGAPSLHTVAHEAAHVVQQRAGVAFSRGVGAAGDAYEQHADAVADRVVRGEPVEALLDRMAPPAAAAAATVQRKIKYPIDAGDEHVATKAEELVDFLVERFPQRSKEYLAGTIKALQEHGRVYASWEDVVEAVTAPKVSVQAESLKPVERDAAMLLAAKAQDSSLALEAAVAARTFLRESHDRANPTAEEIVKIGEPMIRIYTRVGSILLNGVLSPKKLQERGLAFTGSSDKAQDVDKISAWDIDLDRNQDQHYPEPEKPVGHRSISVAIEREDDIKLCGADVCARAGKGEVAARDIVAKAKLTEEMKAAVNDGTYKTKYAQQVTAIHVEVGSAARVNPEDKTLTREAQAEMTDRAFRTAMVVSTGPRLEEHGPRQSRNAPTSTELRTESQLAPEALSHVLVPGFMKWLPSLATLATACEVDLRFVGQTRAQILYYDFGSRTQATSEIDVPDYQSELAKLWEDDKRQMIAHVTRT